VIIRQHYSVLLSRAPIVTALILVLAGLGHANRWTVQIGPHSIFINVSWIGLVVAALLAV
jgi:hypothetical protein